MGSRMKAVRILACTAVLAVLLAPQIGAQVVAYGSGCPGLGPAPTIAYLGSTVPGQNAAVRVEGAPPNGFVYLHIGISDSSSIFGPLPFDISIFAGVNPGCSLLVSPDIRLLLNAKPDGTLQMGFKLPAAFSSDMYFQWAVFESLAPVSVTMTPAVHVSVATNTLLHPVILAPSVVVDHDGDGTEAVLLDGSDSHTHELGHSLIDWTWKEDGTLLASTEVASVPLALGEHAITLLIGDDNVPQDTLLDLATVEVVPATAVPGVSARYHDSGPADPATLLDAVPATADWAELLPDLTVLDGGGTVGGSPYTGQVMVRLQATVELPDNDIYLFAASGGSDRRLFVDGNPVAAAALLPAGAHLVEARFAVPDTTALPLIVTLAQGGGPPSLVPGDELTHDQTDTPAVINAIVVDGVGFFPSSAVTVHWGDVDLTQASGLQITAEQISFNSPPHAPGMQDVTVQTPGGTSNTQVFTYSGSGPVPINFQTAITFGMTAPTAGDWGPDGRLYVTSLTGELKAVRFDDDWNVLQVDTYPGVSGLLNSQSVGLAFNAFDPPSPVRVYVSHMLTYADGGGAVVNPSAYLGAVSMLEGPDFDTPTPLVSGLPQSNSGHNTNGISFDNNGDLLICQGSNTNAGVKDIFLGDLPESPLSGAMLKAETSRLDFNGAVHYRDIVGGLPNDDQRFGEDVEVIPGSHVSVHAPGLRNPYDLVYTTSRLLYATDNGTNLTYGSASTGPTTEIPDPEEPDELLLVELDNYYGSANRNRGKDDARQYVWRGPDEPDLPDEFTQTLVVLPSSQDGITEYRARTFGGQMLGELIVQKWNGGASRIQLSPDGRAVTGVLPLLPVTGALDILMGPGGALIALNQFDNQISVLEPLDTSAPPTEALDVHPWRGPDTGGTPFVIGGHGFGDMGDTLVSFGGLPATLTSVSSRRITGFTPPNPAAGSELMDIVVASNAVQSALPKSFRYLFTPAGNEPGLWKGGDSSGGGELPFTSGDTSTGVIAGELFLVGKSDPSTLVFHMLEANEPGSGWHAHAPRPFPGGAHAAEVVGDKLFLIGGFGAGSEGRVQIYDPDDDTWSLGAPLPWAGGAVNTAAIGGLIYATGGVAGGGTVDNLAVYNPVADSWTLLPSLPAGQGRNGAAAGTDGQRLYFFGGRGPGNGGAGGLADGFDSVQIYDPASFTWTTSLDPGSPLAPLPVPRGDLGRAVFWQGEFYVMGGETASGLGTLSGVHDRVDVYDPTSNTWRLEAPMPTPRHGIDPALFQGRIFVVGGDTATGSAPTDTVEVFTRQ